MPTTRHVEPTLVDLAHFPSSPLRTGGMRTLVADLTPDLPVALLGLEYARKDGRPLHLQVLLPPLGSQDSEDRFPLVVFVQGSAWFDQMLGLHLPALARVAARGFVVAVVEYRPSTVAPFPAQVRDARSALAYLAAHAHELHVADGPVALWGDSSGAHTALLTALTQDDPAFRDEPAGTPVPAIAAVVDYYGPTDITTMNTEPSIQDHRTPDSPEGMLIGGLGVLDHPELTAPTNPVNHLVPGRALPAFLVVHGSKDRVVPFGQSVLLVDALEAAGQQVTFYRLEGADHGGAAFWKPEVLGIVEQFLRTHLGA